ncbi:MAG: MauE/DoxX family redox-associated membrane protein [Streptosporangiaceae bacterium]
MITLISELGYVQIPVLAAVMLGASVTKAFRVLWYRSLSALGPTVLLPVRARRSLAVLVCATEFLLGGGLILTSGRLGSGPPAELVRLATGTFFVIATLALIEMRNVRPEMGCGCFGELSTGPITGRNLARSALLAAAAIGATGVPPITLPRTGGQYAAVLVLFVAELAVIGALSPEVREVLVRIGYSAPCELRVLTPEQTLAALRRTAQWRRHAYLIADERPVDMWREMCWRFVAFTSSYPERDAQVVFAVYLEQRRPAVISALVDISGGAVLPWPAAPPRPRVTTRPVLDAPAAGQHQRRRRYAPAPLPGAAAARWPVGPVPGTSSVTTYRRPAHPRPLPDRWRLRVVRIARAAGVLSPRAQGDQPAGTARSLSPLDRYPALRRPFLVLRWSPIRRPARFMLSRSAAFLMSLLEIVETPIETQTEVQRAQRRPSAAVVLPAHDINPLAVGAAAAPGAGSARDA